VFHCSDFLPKGPASSGGGGSSTRGGGLCHPLDPRFPCGPLGGFRTHWATDFGVLERIFAIMERIVDFPLKQFQFLGLDFISRLPLNFKDLHGHADFRRTSVRTTLQSSARIRSRIRSSAQSSARSSARSSAYRRASIRSYACGRPCTGLPLHPHNMDDYTDDYVHGRPHEIFT